MQLRAGSMWDNPNGLVFTTEVGGPFNQQRADGDSRQRLPPLDFLAFISIQCVTHTP